MPGAPRRSGFIPTSFLIEPSTATIKIEQVRDMAREVLAFPRGPVARFVIDEAHVMTEQASNALLKSLEEPPATSHVFLVTASPQALLPTIRSRCQTLRLGPLPPALLESYLRDRAGLSAEEASLRAALSGGSIGSALAFDSEAYRSSREDLLLFLERAGTAGAVERMEAAQRLADLDDPALALTTLRSLLRDTALLRSGAGARTLITPTWSRAWRPARGSLGGRAPMGGARARPRMPCASTPTDLSMTSFWIARRLTLSDAGIAPRGPRLERAKLPSPVGKPDDSLRPTKAPARRSSDIAPRVVALMNRKLSVPISRRQGAAPLRAKPYRAASPPARADPRRISSRSGDNKTLRVL